MLMTIIKEVKNWPKNNFTVSIEHRRLAGRRQCDYEVERNLIEVSNSLSHRCGMLQFLIDEDELIR